MNEFSHLDKNGKVQMVDVTDKFKTVRMAKFMCVSYFIN